MPDWGGKWFSMSIKKKHLKNAAEGPKQTLKLRITLGIGLMMALSTNIAAPQAATGSVYDLEPKPREIVEQLWSMAMRGELLNRNGWDRSSELFTKPIPFPASEPFSVMSNSYTVVRNSVQDKTAVIWMDCTKLGQIDSNLHFTPAPPTNAYATAMGYNLVATHKHFIMYSADGKVKLRDEEIPESLIWKIDGSQDHPWTTVNTAIRFVLERKAKATDTLVKRNADQTLTTLLTLN